jgi:hypothetical protein
VIALLCLALFLPFLFAGAAYYHCRTLEGSIRKLQCEVFDLRQELEAERTLREYGDLSLEKSSEACGALLLMISDAQSRQGEKIDAIARRPSVGLFGRGLS